MIFIFNILVYALFAWVMSGFAKKSYELYGDDDAMDSYEWAYVAFFTLICALRWNTGVDCYGYTLRFIQGFKPDEGNQEYLYNYVTNFIANNRIPFYFGLGILAFGQIFPIVKALNKYRFILIILPFVLFGNCYFLTYMNGVRQMIVASMFVYACNYILYRKPFKYLLFIFIGALIHHSALMLLPLYLFTYIMPCIEKLNEKRYLLLGIFVSCVILGYSPSFQSLVSYAETISEITGYDNYTDRMSLFLNGGYTAEVHSFGLMMISYFLIGVFTIWFGPRLIYKYENDIPCLNLWYFLAVAYACLYFLVCNVSHVLIRPVHYLIPFQLIIVSLLLWDLLHEERMRNIAYALIVIVCMECCWNLYKNQSPYSSSNYHLSLFYNVSRFYKD